MLMSGVLERLKSWELAEDDSCGQSQCHKKKDVNHLSTIDQYV